MHSLCVFAIEWGLKNFQSNRHYYDGVIRFNSTIYPKSFQEQINIQFKKIRGTFFCNIWYVKVNVVDEVPMVVQHTLRP